MEKAQCIICKKKLYDNLLLCKTCIKNPFLVEDCRSILAGMSKRDLFLSTYSGKYAEIKNVNTKSFWNKNFIRDTTYGEQDAMTREKIDKIVSYFEGKKLRILDLGIGMGYFEERLKNRRNSHNIYGIDISTLAVKRAQSKYSGYFQVGDVKQISNLYKKDFFDVIVAIELLEHVSPSHILTFLNKIHTILKKNGKLIISIPINEGLRNKKENPSGHTRDYTFKIIETELSICSFKVIKRESLFAFQGMYNIKKFLTKILWFRWKPNSLVIIAEKI